MMKKIIISLLIITLFVCSFSSCGKSDAVKAVEEKIKAIGEITLDKLPALEDAEKSYGLLPTKEKKDVKNYDVLEFLRAEYDDIVDFNTQVKNLSNLFDRIFSEYGIKSSDVTDSFNVISERYNAMSESKKESTVGFDELAKQKANYDDVCHKAAESAVVYIKGFYEINKGKNYEITDIGCILQQRDDNNYCLFALKYKDGSTEKEIYAKARFSGTPAVESMISHKDSFYCETAASDDTNALINNNTVLELKTVLENVQA